MDQEVIFRTLRYVGNRWKSREAIQKEQQKSLRKLIRHAYMNSEFYHQVYSDAGVTEENLDSFPISQLPTIDKTILMAHYRQILTVSECFGQEELREYSQSGGEKYLGKYQVVHSSGSTGVPKYFLYDKTAWNSTIAGGIATLLMSIPACKSLKLLACGLRVMFLGAIGGFGGAALVSDGLKSLKASMCVVDINEPLENWAKRFQEFEPNCIIGYPTAIRIMAEKVQGKVKPGSVGLIVCSGEPLSLRNRSFLGSVFDAEMVNFYAASESLGIGTDVGEGSNLFLPDYLNYIEVQDGKMYLTNLMNYAQPLIRYQLSDCIQLVPEEERSTLLPFTQCQLIKGRDDDIFWFQDGQGRTEYLHPLALEDICIPGLMDYQIIQDSANFFHVDAELAGEADTEQILSEMSAQIQAVLDSHGLDFIQFQVIRVGLILPDEFTGKKRLAVPLRRPAKSCQEEMSYAD